MDITVSMTEDEFLEFRQWRNEKDKYDMEKQRDVAKLDNYAEQILRSMQMEKYQDKVKIIDQKRAAELLKLADKQLS